MMQKYLESQRLKPQLYRDNKKNKANKTELANLKTCIGKAKFITNPNGGIIIDLPELKTMTQEIIKYNENDINIAQLIPPKIMIAYSAITTAKISYYLLQIFIMKLLIVV